ncbi:MAG: flagellar hook assembly protein FlgD [Legionellaceae bacterium]|nr:flagellar hook assembly protein FlgD [Legionellaceae bacterium]
MATNSIHGANGNQGMPLMPEAKNQKKSLGQQDFLRLMVAQVKNQDPMDSNKTNGDFMAQLAQFAATDGIGKMQESLSSLSHSLQSNQALQASALVGRKVMVDTDKLALGEEGGATFSAQVPEGVSQLTASVYSESGDLIRNYAIQKGTGLQQFDWDGRNQSGERVAAGTYQLKVTGQYSGEEVALKTMTAANVNSVSIGQNGEGVRLKVAGIGDVSLNDVREITA